MSGTTISTGNITFTTKDAQNVTNQSAYESCHILIMADFSCRNQRGMNNLESLKQRKIIEVDRDNFD